MLAAGVAWGVYSLRGRGVGSAAGVSAGNFLRSVPLALCVSALTWPRASIDATGFLCAVASGAIASGLGYALWYAALPHLRATSAATVQLSVPVLAAAGGIAFLGEALTLRLVVSSAALLGGIGLVVLSRRRGVADGETGHEALKGHARETSERRRER
jgi:drug/metabolite transporter (DMT)-like permease